MAFAGGDAFIAAALAAFGAAIAGAIILGIRRGFRWSARTAKATFKDAFAEAVDEHVEPKFEALKAESLSIADTLAHRTFATAADVKRELVAHEVTERAILHDTIEPMAVTVEAHVRADAEAFAKIDATLGRIEEGLAQDTPPPLMAMRSVDCSKNVWA